MSTLFTLSKFRELINNAIKRYIERLHQIKTLRYALNSQSSIVFAIDFAFPQDTHHIQMDKTSWAHNSTSIRDLNIDEVCYYIVYIYV